MHSVHTSRLQKCDIQYTKTHDNYHCVSPMNVICMIHTFLFAVSRSLTWLIIPPTPTKHNLLVIKCPLPLSLFKIHVMVYCKLTKNSPNGCSRNSSKWAIKRGSTVPKLNNKCCLWSFCADSRPYNHTHSLTTYTLILFPDPQYSTHTWEMRVWWIQYTVLLGMRQPTHFPQNWLHFTYWFSSSN